MDVSALESHIPPQKRRPVEGRTRGVVSFHPDDYNALGVLADELDVSIPVLVMTLYNFYEEHTK